VDITSTGIQSAAENDTGSPSSFLNRRTTQIKRGGRGHGEGADGLLGGADVNSFRENASCRYAPLATDPQGVPIHLEVLRGNRPDTTTLQGLLGGTPVGTVSFRTRWSLTEVFGWMWLARVFTPTGKGALLRRAEAFGTAPDQLPDPSPYAGRKRRSAGLKNPVKAGCLAAG
jgi:hypothetical protein